MEAGTDDPVENPRKRAAYLKRLAADMRKQFEAERAGGPPTRAGLQAALEQAEDDIERLEAETEKAKQQSKKRKREIDEWKAWYNNQAGIDKTAARAKLDSEITWRAAEINALEARIAQLVADDLEAEGRVEQARHQMTALEAGVYDRPIKEDPRLVGVLEELEEAKAAFKKVRPPSSPRKKRRKSARK